MGMSNKIPECRCTAHPHGEDRTRWMFVAECTPEFVVFCCKRCSEIMRSAVIQVRTLGNTRERAKWLAQQQREKLPPEVLKMLKQRKRGRVMYHREEE